MKQVTINLYSYSELGEDAKQKAINEHFDFLTNTDEENTVYSKENVIDNIEANDYIFFEDGELANCTTYTGKHKKAGITELKFHGRVYDITNQIAMVPRNAAYSVANRFFGSDYNMSKTTFDNAMKELGY